MSQIQKETGWQWTHRRHEESLLRSLPTSQLSFTSNSLASCLITPAEHNTHIHNNVNAAALHEQKVWLVHFWRGALKIVRVEMHPEQIIACSVFRHVWRRILEAGMVVASESLGTCDVGYSRLGWWWQASGVVEEHYKARRGEVRKITAGHVKMHLRFAFLWLTHQPE